jgi:hypothetical protein
MRDSTTLVSTHFSMSRRLIIEVSITDRFLTLAPPFAGLYLLLQRRILSVSGDHPASIR